MSAAAPLLRLWHHLGKLGWILAKSTRPAWSGHQPWQKHRPEPAPAAHDTRKRDPDTLLQARKPQRSHGAHPTRTSATLSTQPSPYRAHADAIHTHSRQISPSSPTIAHMKIALSTAAPELRTCIDVGHGLHALLGVQVAASRGEERVSHQPCTADAINAYSGRSTHSSVLGSSIEASAQSAMVLLCQAGDCAASCWPIGCCQSLTVTPA